MKLKDHDTQKNLLSDAVIRLIERVWTNEIYFVVNEQGLANSEEKDTGLRSLINIIKRASDVLLEGEKQPRKVKAKDGKESMVEMTDQMLEQDFKDFLKATCLAIGYEDIPSNPKTYYQKGGLYMFGNRLREICQAKPDALFSPDVAWDGLKPSAEVLSGNKDPKMGKLPTRAEVLEFLQPKLLKIQSALEYICTQNNLVGKMRYIKDICEEVFTPEVGPSQIPELILEIMSEHEDPKKKIEELEKSIKAFHMDADPKTAEKGVAQQAAINKFEVLKELYIKLYKINEQLKQSGYGKKELDEAAENFKKIKKLIANPRDNPFKEPARLDEALAKAFAIDRRGFNTPGTSEATPDILARSQRFDILKKSYQTATALSNSSVFYAYRNSDIPSIAALAEKVIFRESFLKKVLEERSATPTTQK